MFEFDILQSALFILHPYAEGVPFLFILLFLVRIHWMKTEHCVRNFLSFRWLMIWTARIFPFRRCMKGTDSGCGEFEIFIGNFKDFDTFFF